MMSSVSPSARRPLAASPPRLTNGSTAIDGFDVATTGSGRSRPEMIGAEAERRSRDDQRRRDRKTKPPRDRPFARRRRRGGSAKPDGIAPHRALDVLDLLLADEIERQAELSLHVIVGGAGDQHAAGLAELLEPRGDVDGVAEHVVAVDDDVAEIDADAEHEQARRRGIRLRVGELLLDGDGAGDRVDHRAELDQHAVAHRA